MASTTTKATMVPSATTLTKLLPPMATDPPLTTVMLLLAAGTTLLPQELPLLLETGARLPQREAVPLLVPALRVPVVPKLLLVANRALPTVMATPVCAEAPLTP